MGSNISQPVGLSFNVEQSDTKQEHAHRAIFESPLINFISPQTTFKMNIYGGTKINAEMKTAEDTELEFDRTDLELKQSSHHESFGVSINMAPTGVSNFTVSASGHDSNGTTSAQGNFTEEDVAQERARAQAAGGTYTNHRTKETKHSSGYGFSGDLIGLSSLLNGSDVVDFTVPLSGHMEDDNNRFSVFLPSGNLGKTLSGIGEDLTATGHNLGQVAQNFNEHPTSAYVKLMSPLKQGTEWMAEKFSSLGTSTTSATFDPNDGALARLFMPDMQENQQADEDFVNEAILESMTAPQKAPELTEGQKRYLGLLESVELFDEKLAVLQEKYQTQRSQRYGEVYEHAEQEELRRANLTEEQRNFEDYMNRCARSLYTQEGEQPISEEIKQAYLESQAKVYGRARAGKLILSGAGKTAEFMGDTIDAGLTGLENGTAWTAKHVFFASDDIAIGTGRFVRDTADLGTWVLPFAGTVKGISAARYASRFAKVSKASGLAGLSVNATERLLSQFTKEELTTLRSHGILDDLAIKTKPSTGMMGETSQTKNIFEGLSDKARERLIWSMSPQELILLDRHGLLEGFLLKSNSKASMQSGVQMMEVEVGKSSSVPKKGLNYLHSTTEIVNFRDGVLRYAHELNKVSGMMMPEPQRLMLVETLQQNRFVKFGKDEAGRVAYAAHQNLYNDKTKLKLIQEWEKETRQVWPKYKEAIIDKSGEILREAGKPLEFHHIIPQSHNGPHAWWNGAPVHIDDHLSGIHGSNSTLRQLLKMFEK